MQQHNGMNTENLIRSEANSGATKREITGFCPFPYDDYYAFQLSVLHLPQLKAEGLHGVFSIQLLKDIF
jgi:hypothetical protein